MGLSAEQLALLRERWGRELLDPVRREPVQVEGCRTFADLLHLRMGRIGSLIAGYALQADPLPDSQRLHAFWSESCDALFLGLAEELSHYGLAPVAPIAAPRYGIRDPIDLRGCVLRGAPLCGAFLEDVHFEGADLEGARFEGARCIETCFEHTLCPNASFAGSECNIASFKNAVCTGASFEATDCTLALFNGADLRHANFAGAVCFAARFDGALLSGAALDEMSINHLTDFGEPGELAEAAVSRPAHAAKRGEEEDWYITELFPAWLRAAQVACRIRILLRNHGYLFRADEYQYIEMVCQRHLLQHTWYGAFFEWFFKDLMFGYGLKWKRPLISVLVIILVWGGGFALHFFSSGQHDLAGSLGYGLYYSIISFTTLGFGGAHDFSGAFPKLLLCSEALIGNILMPLFLLAYARKILQN